MQVVVNNQDHTTEWLQSRAVLAVMTGTARPEAGCDSRQLGAMRNLSAASPLFMPRIFQKGACVGDLSHTFRSGLNFVKWAVKRERSAHQKA